MTDETFNLAERISEAVHRLVNRMTKNLDPEEEEELRQMLTEQFRFWRRNEY